MRRVKGRGSALLAPVARHMSASRPISVASKGSDPVYPDYEAYGSIETFTAFGSIKKLRMGRCIRAPAIKDLLSVSALAAKGHECILNEHNPRMVCKDGTVVPFYYFNGLFYMLCVTPIGESPASGGNPPTETHYVDEGDLLSSIINLKAYSTENGADNGPDEATVRLDARLLPDNKIMIDTQLSDRMYIRAFIGLGSGLRHP